jgi:hypothetical protein
MPITFQKEDLVATGDLALTDKVNLKNHETLGSLDAIIKTLSDTDFTDYMDKNKN